VRSFEEDGRDFIKAAARRVWRNPFPEFTPKMSKSQTKKGRRALVSGGTRDPAPSSMIDLTSATSAPVHQPTSRRQITHFVMNLPDSAIEFLDAFRGVLAEPELREAYEGRMPMVHCHCFTREVEDQTNAEGDIKQVSVVSVIGRSQPKKTNYRPRSEWKRNWDTR
jgi:tRNA (guanine37-N1)-methyltransferase